MSDKRGKYLPKGVVPRGQSQLARDYPKGYKGAKSRSEHFADGLSDHEVADDPTEEKQSVRSNGPGYYFPN